MQYKTLKSKRETKQKTYLRGFDKGVAQGRMLEEKFQQEEFARKGKILEHQKLEAIVKLLSVAGQFQQQFTNLVSNIV